jgi:hypothetical protein
MRSPVALGDAPPSLPLTRGAADATATCPPSLREAPPRRGVATVDRTMASRTSTTPDDLTNRDMDSASKLLRN